MSDAYWRYNLTHDTGGSGTSSVPRPTSIPGYYPSETTVFGSHVMRGSSGLPAFSTHHLQNEILPLRSGAHGTDSVEGVGGHQELSIPSYSNVLDKRNAAFSINSVVPDPIQERTNGSSVPGDSNILFVDGLPNDCTRREVSHIFRPFIGFKEIRVVHKEARHSGDKAMVLCFVEFDDSKCALTAVEALQGYKFDDKKPNSSNLRIHFANFPFRPPPH